MKIYKIVPLKTEKDIKKAERLQAKGWQPLMVNSVTNTLIMEKDKKTN